VKVWGVDGQVGWRPFERMTLSFSASYNNSELQDNIQTGATTFLATAGKDKNVVIVSVDGGCEGVGNVGKGLIAATSQQYPLKMAAMGVEAGVEYAKTGKKPSGYTDTGVTLIAGKALAGVDSKDVKTGTELCWGKK